MGHESPPDGWRITFEGNRILEYSYRSDNIEVDITPDATPGRSRSRDASDTSYRVELKRNDAGVGSGWELDSGWGDDAEEFELVRVDSMATARERAVEFMDRFNRNRQAVEDEAVESIAPGAADAADEAMDEDGHSGAVFDHEAAAAAVVKDAAAAARAAGEMGADTDAPTAPGFGSPAATDRSADEDRPTDGDMPDGADGSVAEVLHDAVGDAVQVVLHYERGSFETAYHDDDAVAPVEAFQRLHGELRFLDAGLLEGELPDAGPLSFTMTTFETIRLLRIVRGDVTETLVGIDRDAEVAFPELYDRIGGALDDGGP